ncbi:MAG: hypothetical protein LBL48_02630 [Azoarcus sp.]|jgi:hypothetical protein|nr:hypothetical protein [Azoarcus sp.]
MLHEMSTSISSRIRIARQTGEIFTDERTGGELLFRRIEYPTTTVHEQ